MKEREYTWFIIYLQKTCVTIDLEIRIVSRSYFAGLSAFFWCVSLQNGDSKSGG